MQFYKIINRGFEKLSDFKCTLKDAHESAKEADQSNEVRVELVEIDTDKATLASVLSGWGCAEKVLRTWRLTPRGGMADCAIGE